MAEWRESTFCNQCENEQFSRRNAQTAIQTFALISAIMPHNPTSKTRKTHTDQKSLIPIWLFLE